MQMHGLRLLEAEDAIMTNRITTPELIRLLRCGGADSENQKVAASEIERLDELEEFIVRLGYNRDMTPQEPSVPGQIMFRARFKDDD
jgi:hypothetical protein